MFTVFGMNLLAKIAQAESLVLTMPFAVVGQNSPHRLVAVVVIFKLLQRCQQRVPAALGDANREQDKKRIETGLFDHHAMLC